MIIDMEDWRVTRPGDPEPWKVRFAGGLQPEIDGEAHLMLWRGAPYTCLPDLRRCVLRDGVWHDVGTAPSLADSSWHPDLPGYLAEEIAQARRVIRAIPRCHSVEVILSYSRTGDEGEFSSGAMFYRTSDIDPTAACGIVGERLLDLVPNVRAVERSALAFASHLGIQPYDDRTGYDGDLTIAVSHTHACMIHEGGDADDRLVLSSELKDGAWIHSTRIMQRIYEHPGTVEWLRELAHPVGAGRRIFRETCWKNIFSGDPLATSIKIEDEGERGSGRWKVATYELGTLARKGEPAIAA